MVVQQIGIIFSGGKENPSSVINAIKTPHNVAFSMHPGNDDVEETTICFLHPKKYGYTGNLEEYNKWFSEFLDNEYEIFSKFSLTEVEFSFDLYYSGDQCSSELLDSKMIAMFQKYKISSMPINVHKLDSTEINQMLKSEKFDEKTYMDIL